MPPSTIVNVFAVSVALAAADKLAEEADKALMALTVTLLVVEVETDDPDPRVTFNT